MQPAARRPAPGSSGATTGREQVADRTSDPQQPQGDADEHQAAGGGEGGDVRVRQHVAEQQRRAG